MDTTQGSRAINEFMRIEYFPTEINKTTSSSRAYWEDPCLTYDECLNRCSELKKQFRDSIIEPRTRFEASYHENWSQLMPVVEHIESLGFASVIEKYPWQKSELHRVWFTSLNGKQEEIAGARDEKKITAIWLAVVAFIEWWNNKPE